MTSSKKKLPQTLLTREKQLPQSFLTRKQLLFQRNNDSSKKCYKVMQSKYLLTNKDSPETVTLKLKLGHCSAIQIPIGST